jgi:hypothetical protein
VSYSFHHWEHDPVNGRQARPKLSCRDGRAEDQRHPHRFGDGPLPSECAGAASAHASWQAHGARLHSTTTLPDPFPCLGRLGGGGHAEGLSLP